MSMSLRALFGTASHFCEAVHFVDFYLTDRIVGVSPCHPQARKGVAVLIRTYEQRTPLALVQGANLAHVRQSGLGFQVNVLETV